MRAQATPDVSAPQVETRTPEQQRGANLGTTYSRLVNDVVSRVPGLSGAADALPRSFNLSDELTGLAARGAVGVRNLVRGENNDAGAAGDAAARDEREQVAQYRRDNPVRAMLEEGVAQGGAAYLAAAPLAGTQIAQQAGNLARVRPMLTAAGSGAAMGGAVGAGAGESLGERAQNAVTGAAIGGAMGPLGVMGARAVGGIGRAISRAAGRPQPPSRGAMQMLSQVDDATAQATPDGAFFGERIGPQGEELLTSLGQRSDEAGDIVREAARRRLRQSSQEVLAEVQMRTGSRRAVDAIADAVEAERQAAPLFRAAERTTLQPSGRLRELVRRAQAEGLDVSRTAGRQPRGELRLDALLSDDPTEGAISGATVRSLISDVEDAAGSAFMGGQGNQGARFAALERELRDYLKDQSDDFAQASRLWHSTQRDRRALAIGQTVFDEGRNRAQIEYDLRQYMGGFDDLSQSERGQFMAGVLDAVERKLSTVSSGGDAAIRLTKGQISDRLAIVFGEDQAQELAEVMARRAQLARNARVYDPITDSASARRLSAAGAEDRLASGGARGSAADAVDAVGGFLSEPVTGSRRVASQALRGRMSPQEARDLAQLMTRQDASDEMQRFLAAIEAERRRRGAIGLIGGAAGTYGSGQVGRPD